ncbi:protein kinase family protein [Nocardiopsis sp. NPDC007018]|uniref:protein kinase family protein n=1 Tax=Nocardiopsis sp. NPDC007018 TaxID=3155721 RepID=UPI00340FAF6F
MLPLRPHDPPGAGPHRFLARLGEDAHTRSYLAAALGDPAHGEPVRLGRPALRISVLRASRATDPAARAAFVHRVEAATGLGGPYVAVVRDADLRSPVPWVAVERPLGPDLASLVGAHGPLPVAALSAFASATARALASLHAAGHAHGSLTPAGVLLAGDRALIADPGLLPPGETGDVETEAEGETTRRASRGAEPPGAATRGSSEGGTAARSAAERRTAGRSVFEPAEGGGTPAGDVFSWAAVLCFAASGTEGPGGLDGVPPQLRGVVDVCLREDPSLRPSAVDLVDMLGGGTDPVAPWPPELAEAIRAESGPLRTALSAGSTPPAAASGSTPPAPVRVPSATSDALSGSPPAPAPQTAPAAPPAQRRFLALTAGALALTAVAAAGGAGALRMYGPPWPPGSTTADEGAPARTPGLITDASCLDGSGFPEPVDLPDDLDVSEAVFSPDGDVLALAGDGHGLSLWDWRTGEPLATPVPDRELVRDVAFAPVGCALSVTWAEDVDGAREEERPPHRVASTIDVPSGEVLDHLGAQPAPRPDGSRRRTSVSANAFSPDGRWLALASWTGYAVDRDDSIGVVDLETGELVRTFNDRDSTSDLGFLDDDRLASSSGDTVFVWDPESGERVGAVRNVSVSTMATLPGRNQVLFVRDDEVVWHDLGNGTDLGAFRLDEFAERPFAAQVRALTPDPERGWVHVSWYYSTTEEDPADRTTIHRAHLWDVETGEDLLTGDEESPVLRGAAFHPEVIAGIDADGNVGIIDPDTLEVVRTLG